MKSKVYYMSASDDWDEITIGNNNTPLTNATRYYYSESEPIEADNYWHYDTDGVTPIIW